MEETDMGRVLADENKRRELFRRHVGMTSDYAAILAEEAGYLEHISGQQEDGPNTGE